MNTIVLPKVPPRFLSGHPWVYSNEVAMDAAAKALPPGSVVRLCDKGGGFLAVAHFNPHSLIAARVLSRREEEINHAFWLSRLGRAAALREALFHQPFYRLAHGEADGLPGLVIDRYGDVLVMQANTAGMHAAREDIATTLREMFAPSCIYLRGDAPSRALEGLPSENALLLGDTPARVAVLENGVTYYADIAGGQKTGWFYDQRRNRALAAGLAKGRAVLDLCAHSGGFGLLAAKAGAASVTCVDASKTALQLAADAAKDARLSQVAFAEGDMFEWCAKNAPDAFDVVIADPPPFARGKKDVPAALKGYRKLARLGAQQTKRGGFLFLFSCSHAILRERFDDECLRGVSDAGKSALVLARTGADVDHPLHPQLDESAYLKGLLLAIQ